MTTFEKKSQVASLAFAARQRVEIEVLALFASDPVKAGDVLADFKADAGWFFSDDLKAIAICLDDAAKNHLPLTPKKIGELTIPVLRAGGFWNSDDRRRAINGAIWGPGSLWHLLTSVTFDERELRRAIARWINLRAATERPVKNV